MNGYQPDWIGAIGAGIAGVVAFVIARAVMRRSSGMGFYVVVGLLAAVLALGLRVLLRYFGI
jgi:riboflavin transporter FmnP